jgi:hypothetical protein
MKKIPLSKGMFALVDDEDFEELNKYRWFSDKAGYIIGHYVVAKGEKRKTVKMHRVLMKTPRGMTVDHINGDKRDNRKKNLRNCSYSENMMNKGRTSSNTSGFKGVYWHNFGKRWCSAIKVQGKKKHIGSFSTKEEAYEAYCKAAKLYHGEFANFG